MKSKTEYFFNDTDLADVFAGIIKSKTGDKVSLSNNWSIVRKTSEPKGLKLVIEKDVDISVLPKNKTVPERNISVGEF